MWLIIWPNPAIIVFTPPSFGAAATSRRSFICGTIVSSMATKPLTPLVTNRVSSSERTFSASRRPQVEPIGLPVSGISLPIE